MTLKKLADSMNIRPQTLYPYLNGRRAVGAIMAARLASHLGRPDDWREFVKLPVADLKKALGL